MAMDAIGLMHALIAFYADRSEYRAVSSADVLIHAVMTVKGMDEDTAMEWLSEDLSDRRAARG